MKNTNSLVLLACVWALIAFFAFKPGPAPVKWEYCTLIVHGNGFFSGKIGVLLDYGQKDAYSRKKVEENRIKDADGKPLEFNTPTDALNYMGKDGWECIVANYPDDVTPMTFLLRRQLE